VSALRILAIVLVAAGLAAFVLVTRRLAHEPLADPARPTEDTAPSATLAFASNEECRPCHAEIWEEWAGDQHALAWFNEPLLPQDPKRTECTSCHASEPILETGLDQPAVVRASRHAEGIGCIECHRNGEHVEGPLDTADAPCRPRANASFAESSVCSPCHAQHGSHAEWQASRFAAEGVTCQGCHMPLLERASTTGGAPRRVRSHRMRSQRDPTMLAEAVQLEAELEGRTLVVRLANTGAGHAVPGEIFDREMFVATRFVDASGAELERRRESLKTVRREQRATEPSTQLAAGETRRWSYALPPGSGTAEVQLGYKLFFFTPDETAAVVHARSVAF
jgi:cytochrome c554/c'-like protein